MTEQHRPEPTGPATGDGPTRPQDASSAPAQGPSGPPTGPPTGGPAPDARPTGWPAPVHPYPGPHAGSGPHYGGPGPVFGPPVGNYGMPAGYPQPTNERRPGRLRVGMVGLVAGALIGGGAGAGTVVLLDRDGSVAGQTVATQPVVIENPESATTATAAAAKASPSVVTLYVQGASGAGSGSGVVLTEDGYVLTNNHVVSLDDGGSATVQVRTSDGTLYDATVVGTEPSADLAVVKLDGASGLLPATFADSDRVQVGDVAVAIGSPLGLDSTVTDGIISATNRAVSAGSGPADTTVIDALQTDAAINPGNSGGALVNAAGEVIGINTAIATVPSGLPGGGGRSGNIGVGFAIPSNTAQRIGTEIIETGEASQALLGVSARTEADSGNSGVGTGARIVAVEPGSAAAEGGLRPGDVVTAVGDRLITTSTELTAAIRSRTPGEDVELTVGRGQDSRTVMVTLGATD